MTTMILLHILLWSLERCKDNSKIRIFHRNLSVIQNNVGKDVASRIVAEKTMVPFGAIDWTYIIHHIDCQPMVSFETHAFHFFESTD